MQRNSLLFKIQNSKLYNSLQLVLRNLRTKKSLKINKKSYSKFPSGKRKYIFIFILIVLLGFLFFNISKYFQIQVYTYFPEERSTSYILPDSKELNTIFIGFDDTQNTHKFVNMLAIISTDYISGTVKVYNLNPSYLTTVNNNNVTLRTSFNLLTSANEDKMNDFIRLVENVSAIRIDRYLAIDYSDLNNLIDLTSLKLVSDKSYKFDDLFITEGEVIQGEKIYKYINSEVIPEDDLLRRQGQFIKELLESLRDNMTVYRYFLNSPSYTSIIKTSFSKDEFIRFIANISTSDTTISTGYASKKLTLSDLSTLNLEEGISYSDMLLDEDISRSFRNIQVIKEQAKIEIFNATEKSGVAYNLKRKFENTGITVIKTGNYPDNSTENTLYLPKNNPDLFINTIRIIRSILKDDLKIVYGEYKFNYSGDMILVIGKI